MYDHEEQKTAQVGQSRSNVGLGCEPGNGEYKCEMCLGIFSFGWTEEEAKAEAEKKDFDTDDCGIVCDDCYKTTPWGAVA